MVFAQPNKFDVVINLAKAFGATVPQSLLAGADDVSECAPPKPRPTGSD